MEWWENYFSEAFCLSAFAMNCSAKAEVDFILNEVNIAKEARVLDMCCGYGRHTQEIAQRGYKVTGVDYSEVLINKAKNRVGSEQENIEYFIDDIRQFRDERKFDLVLNLFISIGYFESESDNIKAIESLCKCVGENGFIFLELHNYQNVIRDDYEEIKIPGGHKIKTTRSFNNESNRLHMRINIESKANSKDYDMSIRVYELDEILDICSRYGMKYYKHFGSYSGAEFSNDSKRLLLILKKESEFK